MDLRGGRRGLRRPRVPGAVPPHEPVSGRACCGPAPTPAGQLAPVAGVEHARCAQQTHAWAPLEGRPRLPRSASGLPSLCLRCPAPQRAQAAGREPHRRCPEGRQRQGAPLGATGTPGGRCNRCAGARGGGLEPQIVGRRLACVGARLPLSKLPNQLTRRFRAVDVHVGRLFTRTWRPTASRRRSPRSCAPPRSTPTRRAPCCGSRRSSERAREPAGTPGND